MEQNGKIVFKDENGQEDVFYIIEETRLGNVNYLMVTEDGDDSEEAEAYILKDVSKPEDTEAVYEFVEDDRELDALAKVFAELLEDTDIV
ncbi:MAG: DUF1292 domain-containing protein [Parasporobacterium sp.]|nr:DUF1292 domain-containing protein [Parasporobacterium sp.]